MAHEGLSLAPGRIWYSGIGLSFQTARPIRTTFRQRRESVMG
jgi:hypothetical protein